MIDLIVGFGEVIEAQLIHPQLDGDLPNEEVIICSCDYRYFFDSMCF